MRATTTATGAAGGEHTAERAREQPARARAHAGGGLPYLMPTSALSRRQEQDAGEREHEREVPGAGVSEGGRDAQRLMEPSDSASEDEEEYCWSSGGDEEADGAGATMDAVMMETIYADQRASPRRLIPAEDSAGASKQRGSTSLQDSVLARISTLKALWDQGFISADEYERRKASIMDELTYASRPPEAPTTTLRRKSFRRLDGMPMVVPHAPDFRQSVPEAATKHVFNYETREWSSTQVLVNLDETPFSKGSLRVVYHLQDLGGVAAAGGVDADARSFARSRLHSRPRRALSSPPPVSTRKVMPTTAVPEDLKTGGAFVAKLAIDPDEDPQTYFRDIELQAHCAFYAQVYNSYHPPKRVEFIKAWVLELTERNGALCAVEPYMPGEYRKHNNNFGSVSDDERNTPQAFSHFTYEASNHELLAVDIQGVGDLYTDPQIHTLNGDDFGKGNLGALGFQKFLSSHRCNSICRYLKLPPVNPKDRHADAGTLPVQELMNRDRVRPTHFDSRHYYENAPLLQKYVAQYRALELQQRPPRAPGASKAQAPSLWQRALAWLCCDC